MTVDEQPDHTGLDPAAASEIGHQAPAESPEAPVPGAVGEAPGEGPGAAHPLPGEEMPGDVSGAAEPSTGELPGAGEGSLAAQLAAVVDPWQRARMAAQAAESLRRELQEVTEVLAETVGSLVGRSGDVALASRYAEEADDVAGPTADGRDTSDERVPSDGPAAPVGCRVADLVDPFGIARAVVPWCLDGALHIPRLLVRQITSR